MNDFDLSAVASVDVHVKYAHAHGRPGLVWLVARVTDGTLWDVAAHDRHSAAVDEVAERHVPAGGTPLPRVTRSPPLQALYADGFVALFHDCHGVVGCSLPCKGTGGMT